MEHDHTYMSHQNLFDISRYSKMIVQRVRPDAGVLPGWINDAISAVRTHMKDVVHFLRYQSSQGKHYGQTPYPSYTGRPGIDPVMYAPRAYTAVDLFNSSYMANKNLYEISAYADEAIGHTRAGAGIFPAWLEHKLSICAEYLDSIGHWLQNEASLGRQYGQGAGFPTGARKPGLLYGPGQAGIEPTSGLRRFGASFPPGNSSRPPGTGSLPRPSAQYSTIPSGPRPDSRILRPIGPGGTQIPTRPPPIRFDPSISGAQIPTGGGGLGYQPGYGSHIPGPPPTAPMLPSRMEWMMPPSRMLEINRMRLPSRMLQEETGRKFGVPGIPYGQPGWAGAGGVAQVPCLSVRSYSLAERSAGSLAIPPPKPSPPPRRGPRLKTKPKRGRAWRRRQS